MAGRPLNPSYASLLKRHVRYDLAKLHRATEKKAGFPTGAEAEAERDTRVHLLWSSNVPGARKLAAKLACDDGEGPHASLADPCYTRLLQRVTGSALLVSTRAARAAGLRVKTFTLVWLEHAVAAAALLGFDPAPLIAWLRRLILKYLPANPRGWLCVQLHGEYEARSNTFIIHFHGIAAGDYLDTLDGPVRKDLKKQLKKLLDAQRHTLPRNPSTPKVRVVLKVAKLVDAPRQVSYVLQSWWPARPVVVKQKARGSAAVSQGVAASRQVGTQPPRLERVRTKQRIPEPHHSTYLLWLDRQTVSGLRLRMGLGSGG